MAQKYGGEDAKDMVEGMVEQVDFGGSNEAGAGGGEDLGNILQVFTGNQQSGLQSLFSAIGGSMGGMEERASSKGMDPNLISSIVGMLSNSGGAGGGGGGFNLGSLVQVASSLTKGGSGGGGGIEGFLSLISGGGGSSGSSGNILQVQYIYITIY